MDRNYPKLTIEEFGKVLLETGDLDPVYIALHKMREHGDMNEDQLYRWLLAYILCYHCGAACWLSEQATSNAFWDALWDAAENVKEAPVGGRWPRSHERRHWRGEFATNVVARLRRDYPRPELFIRQLWAAGTDHDQRGNPLKIPFSTVSGRVQDHFGFGDWAAFKLADLIDRLGIAPVDFSFNDVVIYKDPVLAAERLLRERKPEEFPPSAMIKPSAIQAVFVYLEEHFGMYGAPPLYDRPVGLNEVETILCKWKSHGNGHYPLHNDLREIHDGLEGWSRICNTAQAFRARMPRVPGGSE